MAISHSRNIAVGENGWLLITHDIESEEWPPSLIIEVRINTF